MQLRINLYKQRSFINFYWRSGVKMLTACQSPLVERIMDVDPRDIKPRVAYLMNRQVVDNYLKDLWVKTGSRFAVDTTKRIRGKGESRDMEHKDEAVDYWEDYFRRYINERSQMMTGAIMDTQAKVVNSIIDKVIADSLNEGLSIGKIQSRLQTELTDGLTIINHYQAERIARTEVIGASNKAGFDSAMQTGMVKSKSWLTSGLPGVRQSHIDYEAMGDVDVDYSYASGLQYPGDPEGEPEEIINCRCTHILNVD